MKTKIALLLIASVFSLAVTNELKAQMTLPYYTGFDNFNQQAGWQMIQKGATGTYIWDYSMVAPYSGTESLYHGYPVGGTTATDDWFVSPSFTIPLGGYVDSIRHSFSGFGMPAVDDTVAIYLMTGNADPALATSKVLLYDYRGANYKNDMLWYKIPAITLQPSTATCYLAFRYKTVNNWLDVKFDNISLRGKKATGISEPHLKASVVAVFPNPANDFISIETKENIQEVSITDLNGRVIYSNTFRKNINLSDFKKGMYLLSCVTASGDRVSSTFVKN